MRKLPWLLSGMVAAGWFAMTPPAAAQENQAPIRMVLAGGPGATTDVLGRLLAQKLAAQMGVNVIVENRAAASGTIAGELVARSNPTGNTLLVNTLSLVLYAAFGSKLGYDIFRDLAPVSLISSAPFVLVVHPLVPANSAAEFIAYARANPGKLAYGSSGSSTQLPLLLFLQANGLSALHVPYNGSAPVVIDLAGGRIQFTMQSMAGVLPLIRDKRIKALAIAGRSRPPRMPELPTLAETVMPGFEAGTWFGVMAAGKTPDAIVRRLNREIVRAMQDPDLRSRLAQENAEPLGSTPEEYAAYLKSEFERWSKLIKSAGVKPD